MIYSAEVNEVRNVIMRYTVEANSLDEAREMLERGETTSEEEVSFDGIRDRHIVGEIRVIS